MDFRQHLRAALAAALAVVVWIGAAAAEDRRPRFYPDDPIQAEPPPRRVGELGYLGIEPVFDFVKNSFAPTPVGTPSARNVNTLGEVPDGPWWVDRRKNGRASLADLRRGPGTDRSPRPPFTVTSGKLDGITPGFRMRDAQGRLYFVKADPYSNPELASGADVIGSRFFHALGYNTPENYLVRVDPDDLSIAPDATIQFASGVPKKMSQGDLRKTLRTARHLPDGSYRLLASLAIEGKIIGPFRYTGTRSDDPNDIVPHEDRRELRGLHVFCAWLNHTDAKSQNTLSSIVEEGGARYVRHYLIDFGAMLGSDSDAPKDARFGHEFIAPRDGKATLSDMFSFGFRTKPWEKVDYVKIQSVGRFSAEAFDPDEWATNYPNPAFLRRLPEDEFWAARRVMEFTEEEIRAIVETAEYSDPRATDHVVSTLLARQRIIGRTIFAKLLPLADFRVENGRIAFDDLGVRHGFDETRQYRYRWAAFDNLAQEEKALNHREPTLPPEWAGAPRDAWFAVTVDSLSRPGQTVQAFLRKTPEGAAVVGLERRQ